VPHRLRWAIANVLEVLAEQGLASKMAELALRKEYGTARQMIVLGLGKIRDPRIIQTLSHNGCLCHKVECKNWEGRMYRDLALIALLIGSSALAGKPAGSTQEVLSKNEQTLRISILPTKQVYNVGELVELRLSLENVGKMTVFVGQYIRLGDWIYSTNIQVTDSSGRVSPERHWSHPYMTDYDPAETVLDAVTRFWLPLRAGYTYSAVIKISGTDYDFLKKPGRYTVRASYTSLGMGEPLNYNRLAASPEDLKKLPFPSWKGTIKSDPVSITIRSTE
jgi:hypothetical protein